MPTPEPDPESQRQPSHHILLLALCQQYARQYLAIAARFIDGVYLFKFCFLPRMGIYRTLLGNRSGRDSFFNNAS